MEGGSLGQTPSTPLARVILAPVDHGLAPRPLKSVLAVTSGVAIIVFGAGPSIHACGIVAGSHPGLAMGASEAWLAPATEAVDSVDAFPSVQARA